MAVNIAVIGVGAIGPRHCQAVLKEPNASLLCVVDPTPSAKALANDLGTAYYPDVRSMLASGKCPDAAIVCTPNHTHVDVTEELLQKDVHVLVEKPVCTDVRSGQRLVRSASLSQAKLLVGHHRRFHPQVEAARHQLSAPAFGDIIAISGIWAVAKPSSYFSVPWRRSSSSGGPILINLIHEIDVLHYLFGPIQRVYAEETKKQRAHDVEEGVALTLRFESGVVGTFLLSDAVTSPWSFEQGSGENPIIPRTGQSYLRILGSKASLSLGDMVQWKYDEKQPSWDQVLQRQQLSVTRDVPFELQVKHLVNVARGDELPRCSGADGLKAVVVCEAIKHSMNEGKPVDISRYEQSLGLHAKL